MSDAIQENKVLVSFKPSQGAIEYQVILDKDSDTILATELQIAAIFGRDRTVINRHIKNIFKEGELDEFSTCAKIAQVRFEGTREIKREVVYYNLDVIISVGYRVKSPLATEFRMWATKKLKEYLINGYSINVNLLQSSTKKIKELESQIDNLNDVILLNQKKITDGFLSIIEHYSKSFQLLNKYDTEDLSIEGLNDNVIYRID
jgi:hypothetical protein